MRANERILAHVRAGWVTPEEIVIQLDDESTISVSNRIEDAVGPESAVLSTPEGAWVWRPGEWP
jgi:hypothetical protein